MNLFDEWYSRKVSRRRLGIKEPRVVSYIYNRVLGPRGSFAGVTMHVEPAADFSFESAAVWPEAENAEALLQSVLDGLLDELLATDISFAVTRVRIILKSIQWHEVDSSQVAFYHAARGAIRRALGLDGGANNVDFRQLYPS